MIRILALPRFSKLGASSRYRIHDYVDYLRSHEFEIDVVPLMSDDYLRSLYEGKRCSYAKIANDYANRLVQLMRSRRYDLVWIQGEALPWLPSFFESMLLQFGAGYVLDYDDALFHRYDSHRNQFIRWGLGNKVRRLMQRASLVVAGNEYLADYAKAAGSPCVQLLPTVVDLSKYPLAVHRESKRFNIGWIGTPVTARLVRSIQPALQSVCRDADVRVTMIGGGSIRMEGVACECREWSKATEASEIQRFDVGIMPLPTDEPFVKGKCGLKLIQYMACGVPVVGTPLGVNADIIHHQVNGYQATTMDQWESSLNKLKQSAQLREEMGVAGREMVENYYSLHVAAPRLADLLRQAVESTSVSGKHVAA